MSIHPLQQTGADVARCEVPARHAPAAERGVLRAFNVRYLPREEFACFSCVGRVARCITGLMQRATRPTQVRRQFPLGGWDGEATEPVAAADSADGRKNQTVVAQQATIGKLQSAEPLSSVVRQRGGASCR